jgi:hypothetical protein
MTNIRHGLRVIQCVDISQHDWHGGQILCNLPPSSQAHAVFIDFSATMQTVDLDEDVSKDDYGRCVSAIIDSKDTGLDLKWICEYWDRDEMKRECWDAHGMSLKHYEFTWRSKAVDPYKFVYDGLDLGIITGNPGVSQGNPYPYPQKPVPICRVRVTHAYGYGFLRVLRVLWVIA